jgi:hypothetical protein
MYLKDDGLTSFFRVLNADRALLRSWTRRSEGLPPYPGAGEVVAVRECKT